MRLDSEGHEYVKRLQAKGLKDAEIRKKLEKARWYDHEIDAAFGVNDPDTPPPAPHERAGVVAATASGQPGAVVERYSTLGLEYGVMFIALGIGAIALGSVIHSYIDVVFGQNQLFDSPLATAAAIIALPVFMLLFLRLNRKEKLHPESREDNSRRRWVQATLLISFLVGITHIIYYVYNLLNGYNEPTYGNYGSAAGSLSAGGYQLLQLAHLAITLAIAGSIFAYYWIDEHRQKQ